MLHDADCREAPQETHHLADAQALISFPRAASFKKCWIPSIKDKASEIWLEDLGLAAKVCPVWIVSPHDPDSLRARGQDRLYLLWPLIDRLTPREAGLLLNPAIL